MELEKLWKKGFVEEVDFCVFIVWIGMKAWE